MVGAIGSNVANTATDTSKSGQDKLNFNKDYDDFLNLLITQLKNQDPTQPLDTNEFTQQIVQLSTVEQSINTNSNLEKLIDMNKTMQNSNLVSYTGMLVEVQGNRVQTDGKTGAKFAYELDENAKNVFVQITDDSGKIVFNGEGTKAAGRNTVTWDGKDTDGNLVPAGTYNISLSVKKEDDTIVGAKPLVGGRVDGVNLAAEPPTLIVNDEEIPIDQVNFIGAPAANSNS